MPKNKPVSQSTVLLPEHRTREADSADKRLDADMEQTMKRTYSELQKRSQQEYDGILGSLYTSWPEHFRNQFEATREQLLKKCSHAKALEYLKLYPCYFAPEYDGRLLMPSAVQGLVGTLYYYYDAMQVGEDEGLRKLAGNDAVAGLRSREGSQMRNSLDKKEVRKIAQEYWLRKPHATIAEIVAASRLAEYRKTYKGRHTLRDWIKDLAPDHRRGRPKRLKI
jgi:hypothetical protein